MTLQKFEAACAEYLQDPEKFGGDALSNLLHDLADDITDDELRTLAQNLCGRGRP
jgi:hypothetical protein